MEEKQLTVEELIELLQHMPPDAPVLAEGCQQCQHPVVGIDLYDWKVILTVNTSV